MKHYRHSVPKNFDQHLSKKNAGLLPGRAYPGKTGS